MKERNYLFDNCKALFIFCVVFAHFLHVGGHFGIGAPSRVIYVICFTFMMEGFFFVSGYFSRNVDKCRATAVEKLLLPYVVFMILSYFARLAIFGGANFHMILPTHAMWFLLVMFYYRFSIKTISRIPFVLPLSAVLFLTAGAIPFFGPVLAAQRACSFLVFFMLGYYCKWEYIEKIRRIPHWIMLIPMAVLVGASIWFSRQSRIGVWVLMFKSSNESLNISFAESVLARFVVAVAALLWLVIWFNLMPNTKLPSKGGLISQIGQNTMTVFLLHVFVRQLVKMANRQDFILLAPGGWIYVGIILVLALLCVYLFSRPIVAKAYDKSMHFIYKPFGKAYEFMVK